MLCGCSVVSVVGTSCGVLGVDAVVESVCTGSAVLGSSVEWTEVWASVVVSCVV